MTQELADAVERFVNSDGFCASDVSQDVIDVLVLLSAAYVDIFLTAQNNLARDGR